MANPQTRGNEFVATVWKAEDKGKYGQANFTTFNKTKSGDFENSQFSFVRFVGNGFEGFQNIVRKLEKSEHGVKILIKNMEIHRKQYLDKDTNKKMYPKNYQFVVWDWNFLEDAQNGKKSLLDTPPVVEEDDDSAFEEDENKVEEDEDDIFGD